MKKQTNLSKILSCILVLGLVCVMLSACGGKDTETDAVKLSFQAASGYDYLKTLDGQTVTINGYMATSSPVDGSFMFLMNLPYQSCPFCVPNTSQLSNTLEVYPKKGDAFSYTAQAVKVVGTLVVSESEDKPFTDMYGYEFCCKIVDATYTIIKAEDLSEDMALWQKIAESDVISDIYGMYDYVNFLCAWNTYYVNSSTDENGEKIPGYYLYASDAERYIYTDGAQYNYGYKDGYFDGIAQKIQSVDPTAFADLVENVRKAETLAKDALAELENKNYTVEYQYVEMFGTEDYVYTLTNGEALNNRMSEVYAEFSNWLGSWEM